MKVIAFNGSPKKNGNTYHAVKMVLGELENRGIETEIIHVGNKNINGCLACGYCSRNKNDKCVNDSDSVNEWIQKMKKADGIILGSPVYYSAIAGNMKSFLDRAFLVAGENKLLRHKVGASVVAVRRSGGIPTFTQLNNYLNYSEMFVPTSNYWNVIHGMNPEEVKQDKEGVQIMKTLGKNMTYLLECLNHSKDVIEKPESEEKIFTNFVR